MTNDLKKIIDTMTDEELDEQFCKKCMKDCEDEECPILVRRNDLYNFRKYGYSVDDKGKKIFGSKEGKNDG